MNLNELIHKETDEIIVYGRRLDVDVAMSIFDKGHAYELVGENPNGDTFLFRRKEEKR